MFISLLGQHILIVGEIDFILLFIRAIFLPSNGYELYGLNGTAVEYFDRTPTVYAALDIAYCFCIRLEKCFTLSK